MATEGTLQVLFDCGDYLEALRAVRLANFNAFVGSVDPSTKGDLGRHRTREMEKRAVVIFFARLLLQYPDEG